MTTPTVTETRRNGNPVGEGVELARYTVPTGERVLCGQRVNGVVRFCWMSLSFSTPHRVSARTAGVVLADALEEEGTPERVTTGNDRQMM